MDENDDQELNLSDEEELITVQKVKHNLKKKSTKIYQISPPGAPKPRKCLVE